MFSNVMLLCFLYEYKEEYATCVRSSRASSTMRIMENEMEKTMEDDRATGIIQ